MNILVGSQLVRKTVIVAAGLLLLLALLMLVQLLYHELKNINSLLLYLAPQFFGLGIMMYVIFSSRESVEIMKKRERSLLTSQERFEYLYLSSPVPYINIDSRGTIFMVNLAAVRLFESSEQKILGLKFYDQLDHESDTKLAIILNQLENRMTVSDVEMQIRTLDGKVRWVLLSAFSYGSKKEQLVSLVDITRQKEIDMAKTEFVTLASHQLRTPIAATRWNFELLGTAHTDRTDEQQKYYERVERNIERLTALVNDFLHVSKLELGTFATMKQSFSLSEFIGDIMGEFDKEIVDKKLTITRSFEPENLVAEFDPRLLRIVIANLLSNAVKYTLPGGSIAISYKKLENDYVFEVSDNGIGVPEGEVKSLFTRFYRATNAQEKHVDGTGLGLYIVKQAVEKMGGSITISSTLNKGTSFIFRLPE